MASEANTTRDHDFIRKWAEDRGGKPAAVKNTESANDVGELRINFPGYRGENSLDDITWDQFFQKFDAKHLVFLYHDKTASGEESRFCKFITQETADDRAQDRKHDGGHAHQEKAHAKHETKSGDRAKAHASDKGDSHAIDVADFKFYPKPGKYLAFVGRISPEKRPDRAIEVAKRTRMPLKIAAKVDPADQEYYDSQIKPLIDGDPLIEFIGPVDETQKRKIMGESLAVIMPIDWPEPFGIVFIEALACGAPVLTCPCGSVPELLEDGVTGFIREDVDGLVEAVGRLGEIDRREVRAYAERRFDTPRMAREYVTIYEQIIEDNTVRQSLPVVQAAKVVAEKIAKIEAAEVLEDHAKVLPINAALTIDESATLP